MDANQDEEMVDVVAASGSSSNNGSTSGSSSNKREPEFQDEEEIEWEKKNGPLSGFDHWDRQYEERYARSTSSWEGAGDPPWLGLG